MFRPRLFSSLSRHIKPRLLVLPLPPLLLLPTTTRAFHSTLQPSSPPPENIVNIPEPPKRERSSKQNKISVTQRRAKKEKREKLFKVRQTLNAAKKAVRDEMMHANQDFLDLTEDPNSFLGKIYTSEKVQEYTQKAREAQILTGPSGQEEKRLFFKNFEAEGTLSEPLKLPLSHGIQADESELVFKQAPHAEVHTNPGISGMNTEERLEVCKKKAELVSKIVSLSLESESGMKQANINRALEIFGRTEGDTGSPEVQCAVMSVKIFHMQRHMLSNRKDFDTKRRLQFMLHKRRKIMKYLKNQSQSRYYDALHKIGLKEVHYI